MKKDTEQGVNLFERAGLSEVFLSDKEREWFRNSDFQARVTEGAKRITEQHAESSFIIGIFCGEETVFPLLYGTAPEDFENGMGNFSMLGFKGFGAAEVDSYPSLDVIKRFLKKHKGKKYQSLDEDTELPISVDATFHFHPTTSGFSEPDVAGYDEERYNAIIPEKEGMALFLATNNYRKGLFFPIYERGFLGKPMVGFGYLAISGVAQSIEYQGAELRRVSPTEQIKLFQRCGFEVSYAVIPVKGGKPQFSGL